MLLKSCVRMFQRLNAPIISFPFGLNSWALKFQKKFIHSTSACCNSNLMEFFEVQSNWGKDEVKTGRSWKLGELRNKSNQDLHKLWYILLKERNMLRTMEEFHQENYTLFPSPERIDKVEESMKNVETVVRERNKAYFLLETGEDGERPGFIVHNAIGLPYYHKQTQHVVPKGVNKWWKKTFKTHFDYDECRHFMKLYHEKISRDNSRIRREENRYARGLLRRFKNVDVNHLKELYPRVKLTADGGRPDNIDGHFSP